MLFYFFVIVSAAWGTPDCTPFLTANASIRKVVTNELPLVTRVTLPARPRIGQALDTYVEILDALHFSTSDPYLEEFERVLIPHYQQTPTFFVSAHFKDLSRSLIKSAARSKAVQDELSKLLRLLREYPEISPYVIRERLIDLARMKIDDSEVLADRIWRRALSVSTRELGANSRCQYNTLREATEDPQRVGPAILRYYNGEHGGKFSLQDQDLREKFFTYYRTAAIHVGLVIAGTYSLYGMNKEVYYEFLIKRPMTQLDRKLLNYQISTTHKTISNFGGVTLPTYILNHPDPNIWND